MDIKDIVTTAFREGETFGFDTALGVFRMCEREGIPISSVHHAISILEQYDRIPSKDPTQ